MAIQENHPMSARTVQANSIISHENISNNALKVVHTLKNAGHEAFLVGGVVRDLLLGLRPKDFDIATSAHPEEVRRLFRNSRVIGRRFRIVHVYFHKEIIEVTTFRSSSTEQHHDRSHSESGMILRDNVYGTIEEDAYRRDFTINALYYDPTDGSLLDFTGGMQDLESKVIRLIGDPVVRYREDPVRMLRAIRFMAKLNFKLHIETEKPVFELHHLLEHIPSARLFEEVLKLFFSGNSVVALELLRKFGLFDALFPQTGKMIGQAEQDSALAFLVKALENMDLRIATNKSVNPAFLFAVLLWLPLQKLQHKYQKKGLKLFPAFYTAMDEVVKQQLRDVTIPRRHIGVMQEIWSLQFHLTKFKKRAILRTFSHPRFRAGYDFLLLRSHIDSRLEFFSTWWTQFQEMDEEGRFELLQSLEGKGHAA